jgi:LemA protein
MDPYRDPNSDFHGYRTAPPLYGDNPATAARRRIILAVILVDLLLIPAGFGVWAYNQMASHNEAVDAAWAQVESNLQRRADLIPQLVASVNRYVRHEKEVLTVVTRERAQGQAEAEQTFAALERAQVESAEQRAARGNGPPANAEAFADLEQGQAAVWRGVQSVLAVSERYPELRSADQFLALQAQLEGSENRINVARMVFNDAVRDYNAARVKLPTSLVAQAWGLERRPYFGASASAHATVVPSFE